MCQRIMLSFIGFLSSSLKQHPIRCLSINFTTRCRLLAHSHGSRKQVRWLCTAVCPGKAYASTSFLLSILQLLANFTACVLSCRTNAAPRKSLCDCCCTDWQSSCQEAHSSRSRCGSASTLPATYSTAAALTHQKHTPPHQKQQKQLAGGSRSHTPHQIETYTNIATASSQSDSKACDVASSACNSS
jgi:hypothetical protein